MEKPKLAQSWFDDPDGAYEAQIDSLMRSFNRGIISGSETGHGRNIAGQCRDLAKKFNEQSRRS